MSYFNYLESISFGSGCFIFRKFISLEIQLYRDFSLSPSLLLFFSPSFLFPLASLPLENTRRAIQNENKRNGCANDFYTKAEARVDYVISHYRTYFPVESHLDNRKHCLKCRYLRALNTPTEIPTCPFSFLARPSLQGSTNRNCGDAAVKFYLRD